MPDIEGASEAYDSGGFGTELGFGDSPCLVVIDLQKAMTDPEQPRGTDHSAVVEAASELIDVAHETDVPVIFVRGIFPNSHIPKTGMYVERNPGLKELRPGMVGVEFDDRLDVHEEDYVLDKRVPSAFHDTELNSVLTHMGVDTIVVAGCNTSGCVRATIVDGCQYGYYTIVASECVGDRTVEQHEMSLYEMDLKYADVKPMAAVRAHFEER